MCVCVCVCVCVCACGVCVCGCVFAHVCACACVQMNGCEDVYADCACASVCRGVYVCRHREDQYIHALCRYCDPDLLDEEWGNAFERCFSRQCNRVVKAYKAFMLDADTRLEGVVQRLWSRASELNLRSIGGALAALVMFLVSLLYNVWYFGSLCTNFDIAGGST